MVSPCGLWLPHWSEGLRVCDLGNPAPCGVQVLGTRGGLWYLRQRPLGGGVCACGDGLAGLRELQGRGLLWDCRFTEFSAEFKAVVPLVVCKWEESRTGGRGNHTYSQGASTSAHGAGTLGKEAPVVIDRTTWEYTIRKKIHFKVESSSHTK